MVYMVYAYVHIVNYDYDYEKKTRNDTTAAKSYHMTGMIYFLIYRYCT